MSKLKLSSINIDGKGIINSIQSIINTVKYRKYAKEGFVTIIHINNQNNVIKILNGKVSDDHILQIKGLDQPYLINKIYMLPTKKLVTKCAIIKEDIPTTIDVNVKDNSKLTPQLLKKYEKIKIMSELKSFDLGQILIGLLLGFIMGSIGTILLLMLYNSMM